VNAVIELVVALDVIELVVALDVIELVVALDVIELVVALDVPVDASPEAKTAALAAEMGRLAPVYLNDPNVVAAGRWEDVVDGEPVNTVGRLKAEKDEAQLQEHLAKNAETRMRTAGDALAEATRKRIRGDATTSVALQRLVDGWESSR
jgi:hypothetical protein